MLLLADTGSHIMPALSKFVTCTWSYLPVPCQSYSPSTSHHFVFFSKEKNTLPFHSSLWRTLQTNLDGQKRFVTATKEARVRFPKQFKAIKSSTSANPRGLPKSHEAFHQATSHLLYYRLVLQPVHQSSELNLHLISGEWISRTYPMAPYARENFHSTNTFSHVCNLDFWILRTEKVSSWSWTGWSLAYGKYRSVWPGSTSIFALMACMEARKSPLYFSWLLQSPACHVKSMVSKFSGSTTSALVLPYECQHTFGECPSINIWS